MSDRLVFSNVLNQERYGSHEARDYRISGVNVQIVASMPCLSARICPSRVHCADTTSLVPSPASRVVRPDVRSTSPNCMNQESAGDQRRRQQAVGADPADGD